MPLCIVCCHPIREEISFQALFLEVCTYLAARGSGGSKTNIFLNTQVGIRKGFKTEFGRAGKTKYHGKYFPLHHAFFGLANYLLPQLLSFSKWQTSLLQFLEARQGF